MLLVVKQIGFILLLGCTLLVLVIGLMLPQIPQPQDYHHFADQRSWLSVRNAWNVLSNLPFALVGIWGLFLLLSKPIQFVDKREYWLWTYISCGLILVAFGSSYYHLEPGDGRLVWDRLPMTIVFMSFVTVVISDRVSSKLAFCLWPFLLVLGIFSVVQWYFSEIIGAGDLRLYLAVQLYAILIALVMFPLPSHFTRPWDIAVIALLYGLAKVFEFYDKQIYQLCGGVISGHTLKHLAAALASYWLIRMMWKRQLRE